MRLDNKTYYIIDNLLSDTYTVQNPRYRYWGEDVEEYYLLIWCKYQAASKESCKYEEGTQEYNKAISIEITYSKIFNLLIENYPHLKDWSKEIIGTGGLKIC